MANLDIFKETTQQEILAELKAQNALISILARGYDIDSPQALQELCASGQIGKWLSVGDVIFIPWTDGTPATPVEYSYPFVVADIADVYDANNVLHKNGLWLQAMYCTPQEIQFDAAETVEATEETFTEGYYYYIKDAGNNFVQQTVTYGEEIPGGTTYYHHILSGAGTAIRYGSNRWSKSACRQWLNSDAAKGTSWWTAQHACDVAPGQATTRPGFLNGFPSDWRAIFKPVKVRTACNTVTDGGVTDTTYDTFFLPSLEQMYGLPQASGVEGSYWPYWKEETGFTSPSNSASDARKIPCVGNPGGSACYAFLRSAVRGTASTVWYLYTGGTLVSNYAYNALRALPACVIY